MDFCGLDSPGYEIQDEDGDGDEDEKLSNAVLNCLKLADQYGLKSMAFPAISTGRFRIPLDRSVNIMFQTVIPYVKGSTGLERLVFCVFGKENFKVFHSELQAQLPIRVVK